MRRDMAATAARHAARLLLLAGVVVGAYLTLSLFARAAQADTGSKERIGGLGQVATGASPAVETSKVIPVPKAAALAGVRSQPPVTQAVTPPPFGRATKLLVYRRSSVAAEGSLPPRSAGDCTMRSEASVS